MTMTIVDDEVSGCRLVQEWHGNKDSAEQLLLSVPKSAIALRLTPLFMPWGTYAVKSAWGRTPEVEQRRGARRRNAHHSPEKRDAVTAAVSLWKAYRETTRRPTIAEFMLMQGHLIPQGVTAVDIKRRMAWESHRAIRASERDDSAQARTGKARRMT